VTREGYSADLKLADLSSAKLNNANLSSANLTHATLEGANLSYANLESANGLTERQLSKALLCNTRFPPEFKSLSNRDCEKLKKREGRRSLLA
jgi:uncharacterized protein YjbI with pentapeptide repeats